MQQAIIKFWSWEKSIMVRCENGTWDSKRFIPIVVNIISRKYIKGLGELKKGWYYEYVIEPTEIERLKTDMYWIPKIDWEFIRDMVNGITYEPCKALKLQGITETIF